MENYESEIRPALARWMGRLEYLDKGVVRITMADGYQRAFDGDFTRYLPDPLRQPADAWALMESLLRHFKSVHLSTHSQEFECLIRQWIPERGGTDTWEVADTPRAALVLAAWEVVRERKTP